MAAILSLLPLLFAGATCHLDLTVQYDSLNLVQTDARKTWKMDMHKKTHLGRNSQGQPMGSGLHKKFVRSDPPVAFVHIPKNAGSTIEELGFKTSKIAWGRYRMFGMIDMPDGYACSAHHIPPQYSPGEIKGMYATRDRLFCISRNPYERAVSEYTYLLSAPKGQIDNETGLVESFECTPEGLNNFLQKAMTAVISGKKFIADCHFLPQSEYIWEGDKQWCTNILRMDGLPGNFNNLMWSLGVNLTLGEKRENTAAHKCPGVSVASLTEKTKAMLNRVYHDDFQKLGY